MSGSGEETPEETLARRRLEPYVGQLEQTDVPGTSGLPDYRLIGPRHGHVEVTSRPDRDRRMLRSAITQRRRFAVKAPGAWWLYLHPGVDTRKLPNAPGLDLVLNAATQADRVILPGDCPPEVAKFMHSLGIEGVTYRYAQGPTGTVNLTTGSTGATGVQGEDVDVWLRQTFQEPSILKRVQKLSRAGGYGRHLYLQVDSASETGLAIAVGLRATSYSGAAPYTLPEYEPPDDLTDLWVWPDSPGPGLHHRRDRGWEIVQDEPWE